MLLLWNSKKINSFKSVEQIHKVDTVSIEGSRRLKPVLLPIQLLPLYESKQNIV